MLTNIFKHEEKQTGYTAKTNIRSTMLQSYAEFGVSTESEAKYVDQKVADLAECAAGLGMLTVAASAVIGATAAAATIAINSVNNNKRKNNEREKIMDFRINQIEAGESIDQINKNCRVAKGKSAETLSDKAKAKIEAAKEKAAAKLDAAKAAAATKGAKK